MAGYSRWPVPDHLSLLDQVCCYVAKSRFGSIQEIYFLIPVLDKVEQKCSTIIKFQQLVPLIANCPARSLVPSGGSELLTVNE